MEMAVLGRFGDWFCYASAGVLLCVCAHLDDWMMEVAEGRNMS